MPSKSKDVDPFKALADMGLELKRTSTTRTNNIYSYRPHPKQQKFHGSTKRRKLYIGGNRSGKTVGGIVEDIWWLKGEHPYRKLPMFDGEPCRGRIVTVDITEGLNQIILPQLARWIPKSLLINGSWEDSYFKQERVLRLANKAECEFLTYEMDTEKFAGTSRHFVHCDEEPRKDIYEECGARLIDTSGSLWITMTPVEGMTWVYDYLYEPGIEGSDLIDVIEVSIHENPFLPEGEAELFLAGLDPEDRKAREEGKFVQLGGLIYPNFSPDIHVKAPYMPPPGAFVALSLDHGLTNPTAWLWHSVTPDGDVITFSEHYEGGKTIDYHASKVLQRNAELNLTPDLIIGDPSIRNIDPITGTSIHQEYMKYGVPITLANNDVMAGIIRTRRYINVHPTLQRPKWVTTVDCPNLIKEMKKYRWKTYASKKIAYQNNTPEAPQKKDDHACDSLRYFIMSQPDLAGGFYDEHTVNKNPMGIPDTSLANYRAGDAVKSSSPTPWANVDTAWEVDEFMGSDW